MTTTGSAASSSDRRPQPTAPARTRRRSRLLGGTAVLAAAIAGWTWAGPRPAPVEHKVDVTARSFAFEPAVLRVNAGDRVTLRLRSADVVHGFHLEGYDLDATVYPLRREFEVRRNGGREQVEAVTFTAERAGKYRYRCSVTCGAMHPFMSGELIVEPNRTWRAAVAAAVAVTLVAAVLVRNGQHGA